MNNPAIDMTRHEDFVGGYSSELLERLIHQVDALRQGAKELETQMQAEVDAIPPSHRPSARNLLHYLALRRHDIRAMQRELTALGLSSIGRAEAHVMASLNALMRALQHMLGRVGTSLLDDAPVDFTTGPAMLTEHTDALLGPRPPGRAVRLMVTMPSEAATNSSLVRDFVAAGMDVMRINCAHDGPEAWGKMVDDLHQAEQATQRRCRILFDLSGPKLRTAAIDPGPRVLRWAPVWDKAGRLVRRAQVWVGERGTAPPEANVILPVGDSVVTAAKSGDELRLVDVRGRNRTLRVTKMGERGFWAESDRGAYISSGTPVELVRGSQGLADSIVGELTPVPQTLDVRVGDTLVLTPQEIPARMPLRDTADHLVEPGSIGCTLAEVFCDVRIGQRIFFDDGKIAGIIRFIEPARITVQITQTQRLIAKLGGDKGINLPDTTLHLPALTADDLKDLDCAVKHADMIGLSFVRQPSDVQRLVEELQKHEGVKPGIILKIETRQGFEQLPRLLLAALRCPQAGIMLARGDLAVEVGFERLAEIQEEILWLCEASHVPVIWATQVLESMAKDGQPSRAEVTDAAMSGRAECVMLNKGPHIIWALQLLCGVLQRMQNHQEKKTSMLRRLEVSRIL